MGMPILGFDPLPTRYIRYFIAQQWCPSSPSYDCQLWGSTDIRGFEELYKCPFQGSLRPNAARPREAIANSDISLRLCRARGQAHGLDPSAIFHGRGASSTKSDNSIYYGGGSFRIQCHTQADPSVVAWRYHQKIKFPIRSWIGAVCGD